jgi:hypothetical protein
MKQTQKSQQGKYDKAGEKKGKGENSSARNVKKKEDISSGDTKEEPTTPATPTIPSPPDPPRREYEDPGHEHTYNPPTANPSTRESTGGYVSK